MIDHLMGAAMLRQCRADIAALPDTMAEAEFACPTCGKAVQALLGRHRKRFLIHHTASGCWTPRPVKKRAPSGWRFPALVPKPYEPN